MYLLSLTKPDSCARKKKPKKWDIAGSKRTEGTKAYLDGAMQNVPVTMVNPTAEQALQEPQLIENSTEYTFHV